jgi:hypothetical protein
MITFRATARELLLAERLKSLAFGQFAWLPETTRVEDAGSGILVAPRLALSAKHVSTSYARLDDGLQARARRRTPFDPQYQRTISRAEFATLIFQFAAGAENVSWGVKFDVPSYDTDITTISVEPRTPAAERAEPGLNYLEWEFLPPRVGATVRVVGWPDQNIAFEGSEYHAQVSLCIERATVVELVNPMQAHGFGEFPGFRIDRQLGHGFSGGAVIFEERLIGIFSGPDLVASLWPLALHTYLDGGEQERSFANLLDTGAIRARDWANVRGQVYREVCDEALAGSHVETRCHKRHVVLASACPKPPLGFTLHRT